MKLLKKYLLLSLIAPLLFSLLSFKTYSSLEEKELVIIRIQEAQGLNQSSHILISEKGQIRTIELERFGSISNNKKNIEVISTLLNQYYKDGYKVENSSSVTATGFGITTYILTK